MFGSHWFQWFLQAFAALNLTEEQRLPIRKLVYLDEDNAILLLVLNFVVEIRVNLRWQLRTAPKWRGCGENFPLFYWWSVLLWHMNTTLQLESHPTLDYTLLNGATNFTEAILLWFDRTWLSRKSRNMSEKFLYFIGIYGTFALLLRWEKKKRTVRFK